jgi:hypothetical protein
VEVEWCRGLKLKLRLGNDISWWVFVGGRCEPNELALFAAILEPGMTVLDVGAAPKEWRPPDPERSGQVRARRPRR